MKFSVRISPTEQKAYEIVVPPENPPPGAEIASAGLSKVIEELRAIVPTDGRNFEEPTLEAA